MVPASVGEAILDKAVPGWRRMAEPALQAALASAFGPAHEVPAAAIGDGRRQVARRAMGLPEIPDPFADHVRQMNARAPLERAFRGYPPKP